LTARVSLGGDVRVGFGWRGGADLLWIDQDRLCLRCFRTYCFAPDEIVCIERMKPAWLDPGVRIVHNRADYPRQMSFSCRGGSDEVFRLLARAGFVPRGTGPAGRSSLRPAAWFLVVAMAIHAISLLLLRILR
jgi:hypothetical protein